MRRRHELALTLGLIALATLPGCAGTEVEVIASGALRGPASFTDTVFDARGRSLEVGEGLVKVADFEVSKRFWALLTFIRFQGAEWDVTDVVNDALADQGGDAILNLEVDTTGCFYMPLATLLLIVPSYIDVTLRGDVVRTVSDIGDASRSTGSLPALEGAQVGLDQTDLVVAVDELEPLER